ncbi:NAD(P)/FAD-dependent oxidoreductase [Cupriavidus taiwanensis]|uniref:Putative FAD dependent oxidoreductase n=1 Tax=Cupriavidus taiwanensis TaxID=164546 RepID=A0A7Z7J9B9_9BURK|nr:NAD(P)/FAD-dependent oxidoreductase [Cupriavidus taiwanensis]SOY85843.1 putative FAD dependent oxidoreductase [Cupriavidus taiwanensis]SOZ02165.1 putative FAD dependent oxidoreductase [Cupriavidus taiwanensis]SOZ05153.1 putative FAD dependent oxidoreductase [Cupriavidus taiwanensis]SPC09635.1 putative FAD dependent oxidoreductase [Cupriavidus taiwanensis]SPD39422.1 putative FAD dependent oxidoreductase [Cupriavidus taiwanensis]
METVDCVVIGAGVVGLAVARALALQGREVIILEAENAFGTITSARNSEVIHAGIYYPAGSLKAQLCVRGKAMLYDYCASRHVAHQRCGKLIVATSEAQVATLEGIRAKAAANGVDDLRLIGRAEAQALEPQLQCHAALLSPSTGIVDSHGLMTALLGDAENAGAMLAVQSPVLGGAVTADGIRLEIGAEDGSATTLLARTVVNSAGLTAPELARRIDGMPETHIPPQYYAKGCYFTLAGRAPFSRLIYPVPEAAGLGVHLTIDLGGQARFGPNVRWIDEIEYGVDASDADAFYDEVRRYWPGLADGALQPGYAGIRPKISGPHEAAADFRIDGPAVHGVPGLVHLFGIESPGLTSSLAIAERVCAALD